MFHFQYASLQSILYVCLIIQFKNEYKNNRDIHTLTWMLLQSFITLQVTFIHTLHTGPTPSISQTQTELRTALTYVNKLAQLIQLLLSLNLIRSRTMSLTANSNG